MKVYRISKCNFINDLSGTGAAMFGGRWSSKGTYILYTAASPSLALLEILVHTSSFSNIDYCLLELDIPENKILEIHPEQLPDEWRQLPAPAFLQKNGDEFCNKKDFLVLKIPSAIIPEEYNFLINPNHPDFNKIKVVRKKRITIDQRLKT